MKLKSIKSIVETVSKLTRTLHGIISEQEESKVTPSKRTLLLIMYRNIEFNIEFVQV